jgi:iron complex outermembrane receptor protein
MKSAIVRVAAAVLALLGLLQPARAQDTAGEMTGVVRDATGGVLVGAVVVLRTPDGTAVQTVATDARGRYLLRGVAPGGYTLFVHKDGFTPVNEEFRVDGAGGGKDFTLATAGFAEEVTVAFTGEHLQTALKADAPARDIPLTVKSYTSSFIKAIDTKQVAELYTYMNGVNRSGGGAYDTTIRGFSAGEPNSLQIDGLPGLPARMNSPNVANVERIEVLKGPSSILYGRAKPGGMLNLVTKRPQAVRLHEIELRGGTFFGTGPGFGDENSYRMDADFTGPVGGSPKVLYRLIASYDKVNSFRNFVQNEDIFVVPSLSIHLGEGSLLTLDGEYRRLSNSLDQGLVAPRNDIRFIAPITTRYQEPDDFEDEDGYSFNGRYTRQFSARTMWTFTWRSVYHVDQRKGFENILVEADDVRVRRRDRDQRNRRNYHYADTYLNRDFGTGSVLHHVLFGLSGGLEVRDFDRLRFGDTGFQINLTNPVYGQQPRPVPNPGFHQNFHLTDYAVYAQDRLDIGRHWKAVASVRGSGLRSEFKELRLADPDRERTVGAVNPMLGVVFQPDNRWSLYGSFATSYDPQGVTAVDANGQNSFDPETGSQWEGGVKAALFGGKVDATAAAYRIVRDNVLLALGGGVSTQIGQQESKGFELDLRLTPMQNWQTILGYAFTDAAVTEDVNPIVVGAPLVNQARHGFNFWSRYDVTSGAAKGLGVGVGLIWRDDRPGSLPAAVVQTGTPDPIRPVAQAALILPGYTRIDGGVYYATGRYELTLRVNNITDETYYESAFNLTQIFPGAPREATLSMRVRF